MLSLRKQFLINGTYIQTLEDEATGHKLRNGMMKYYNLFQRFALSQIYGS